MDLIQLFQNPFLLALARVLLGWVFLVWGLRKLRAREKFRGSVTAYKVLPPRLVGPFAITLPWIEAGIGLLLLLGISTQMSALSSTVLLTAFLIAIMINLARGRDNIECGCSGGNQPQPIGRSILVRNILLLWLSVQIMLWGGGFAALDNQSLSALFSGNGIFGRILIPFFVSAAGLVMLAKIVRQLYRLIVLMDRHVGSSTPPMEAVAQSPQISGTAP
jgi:uncharacterized membrane protein YphA (DoxX/SURF4 family)